MANIGYNDEFDYLKEEDSNAAEEAFAPKIKGSKKASLTPEEDANEESATELAEEEKKLEKEVKVEKKPPREHESQIYIVKVTTNKEDKALEMIADKVKKKKIGIYAIARPHGLRGYILRIPRSQARRRCSI